MCFFIFPNETKLKQETIIVQKYSCAPEMYLHWIHVNAYSFVKRHGVSFKWRSSCKRRYRDLSTANNHSSANVGAQEKHHIHQRNYQVYQWYSTDILVDKYLENAKHLVFCTSFYDCDYLLLWPEEEDKSEHKLQEILEAKPVFLIPMSIVCTQ